MKTQKDQLSLLQQKERDLVISIAKEEYPEHAGEFEALGDAVSRYYGSRRAQKESLEDGAEEKAAKIRERIEKKKAMIEKHRETLEKYEQQLAEVDPALRRTALQEAEERAEAEIAEIYIEKIADIGLNPDDLKCLLPKPFLEVILGDEDEESVSQEADPE